MFTRCPSCNSTFRVTATILQMAEGEVRCGACGGVFNALHTLLDDWSGADFPASGTVRLENPDAAPEPETSEVAENLEFNVPENEWQRFFITPKHAAPMPETRAEPGLGPDFDGPGPGEPAQIHPRTVESAGDDPFFAPADEGEPAWRPVDGDSPQQSGLPAEQVPADDVPASTLEEETSDTDTWQAFLRETEARPVTQQQDDEESDEEDTPSFVLGDEPPPAQRPQFLVRGREDEPFEYGEAAPAAESVVPEEDGTGLGEDPGADDEDDADPGLETEAEPKFSPEAVTGAGDLPAGSRRRDPEWGSGESAAVDEPPEDPQPGVDTVLDWGPAPDFPGAREHRPTHTGRWLAASLLAVLALAGQGIHHFRDSLAVDPAVGSLVRQAYARLGLDLHPAWPLAVFEVRGMKAIAENSAPGTLDIVAGIAVTGTQPVGLPMVRVVLRDRWSNPVASGVFAASDYLAEPPPASGLYPPGTLIPVQISLKDPGSVAQGYEFDVCIPNRTAGLQCKSTRDPFRN